MVHVLVSKSVSSNLESTAHVGVFRSTHISASRVYSEVSHVLTVVTTMGAWKSVDIDSEDTEDLDQSKHAPKATES